ncbi:hypothetical protein [Treponema bryantii]|uniref:hypothetical protein n=1 Tax=Treponema bryantii TaxID=163 RepID=UPI0018C963FD|nr:hypothetical protein [Treponema bryantii]
MLSFKKGLLQRILILFIFLICFEGLFAEEEHPSMEPLFSVFSVLGSKSEAGNTNYTADEVFEMGLLFSECERGSEVWKRCWNQFEDIKKEVTSHEIMSLSEEERGRAILKLLYRDYLAAYSLNQTKIDLAMDKGFYNCVSSAVLYMAAAKAAELDVRGQRTTQHAFCSIYVPVTDGKPGQLKKIDVETTNPYGFNPGSKEEIEHESQIRKYYVVPKKYYSNRTEVSDGVFTGLIAGNLCSEYIKSENYKKAVPLGAARWEAACKENSKSVASVRNEFDILAANYVNLIPSSAAAYSSTLDWFSTFIDRWGNTAFLQKNLDSSFINLLVLCNKEQDYPLAKSAYEKYKERISPAQITKSEEIITDIIILSATDALSTEEKIVETNRLLTTKDFSNPVRQKRAQLHLESFWLDKLNSLMNSREYEEGYRAAALALNQLPKSTKVKAMQNNFYNNSIAIIHNNFARQANGGNFDEAQAILEAGLEKFPEDRTLTKDLSDLQKVRN